MDPLQQQIQQKIIGNVLVDKCQHSENIIFHQSWCTQERCIRFTTPFFREIFPAVAARGEHLKTRDYAIYEVHNIPGELLIECTVAQHLLPKECQATLEHLKNLGIVKNRKSDSCTLGHWKIKNMQDMTGLFAEFDDFLAVELPVFEECIHMELKDPDISAHLEEGAKLERISQGYERNPLARQRCLDARGTACTVCGMDFGKVYGPEFKGMIEVHHIVPLSHIHRGHVVNPVKDLIPVCPNCHRALHSKKEGVFTAQELKKFMNIAAYVKGCSQKGALKNEIKLQYAALPQ